MPIPLSQAPSIVAGSSLPPFIPLARPPQPFLVATDVKTSDYLSDYGQYVLVDPTGGEVTVGLPAAVSKPGQMVLVKNDSDSTNGVFVSGLQSIDGFDFATITQARGYIWLISDGSNWTVTTNVGATLGNNVILQG